MTANRLMIVDDSLIMRMRIKDIAAEVGWDVVAEAADGEEAVKLFQELRPELVTLDMVMPEMDGLAALKAIRAVDPQAQVVMVSAVDQKQKLNECIAGGAMDFIVKPFEPARLRAFFARYLKDETVA